MKQACNITLAISFSCAAMGVAAQPAAERTGIAECAAIESAVARLDCFDALARSARSAGSANEEAAPAREPAVESPNPASGAAEQSSASPPAVEPANSPSGRDARAADRAEREQIGQVASLREIQQGRVEVTLTNGQVWRQTNSDRYNLLVGHEVRIYSTGFGQYFRLSSTEARGFIQVERVR